MLRKLMVIEARFQSVSFLYVCVDATEEVPVSFWQFVNDSAPVPRFTSTYLLAGSKRAASVPTATGYSDISVSVTSISSYLRTGKGNSCSFL
jgi:hypothetical protein